MTIRQLYARLYKHYGPQGWWPTTPLQAPGPVYWPSFALRNLTERERFEICLGAILTQNTSWSNVVRVLAGLKAKGFLGLKDLLQLPRRRLEKLLRSSGYFRQKAVRVREFLKTVQAEAGGSFERFLRGPLPHARERLLKIKGVGPETADSMLLYGGGRPIFVVDAYTRRTGERLGILKGTESYEEVQRIFMKALPPSPHLYGEFHALLVQLAKDACRRKPVCGICSLKSSCPTGRKR